MDELDAVEKLAELARLEDAPATDVSAGVMAEIRRTQPSPLLPLSLVAAASIAAAAIVLILALSGGSPAPDPMIELFAPLEMVTL